MSSYKKQFKSAMRSIDQFGYPISLTYKNQENYTTAVGGISTVLAGLALFLYLIFSFRSLILKDASVTSQFISTDILRSPGNFTMNSTNF